MKFGDLQIGDTIVPATDSANYTGIVVNKDEYGVLVRWFDKLSGKTHPHSPHKYNNTTENSHYKKGPNKSEEADWE